MLLNLSLTFLALSVCFLCAQSSLTGATRQKSDQLPDQVESLPLKQGKFVFRGRKRILSQNKRWGANPFPCAVKQSLHSLQSKWHLIWFCCWSLRYPECFQDIYSGCLATLARYEGGRNLMSRHTPSCTEAWVRVCTHTHTHTNGGKHPEIKPRVAGLISQDTPGHVRQVEIQIGLTRSKLFSGITCLSCNHSSAFLFLILN